ncbi:MAG: flagellar M-ring protein FliF [Chloroflexi bacterium]|nr:flagellar M-ring protein FliF [Chloroflexota bacterium]
MLAVLPAPRDARGVWLNLSRNQRLALGGIALAAAVVLVMFVTLSRPAEYQAAFSDLREEDAAAVVAKLKEAKIPYELAERGTIKVPTGQVQEARLMIAASGVVKQGSGVGFEIFGEPHFGLTEFAEKINYQRALEGELGRSIGRIDAVEEARVHLTLPEQSLFVSQKKDPTAAAVVRLKQGRKLDSAQVQGIIQLIAGSVEGLKPEGVTVMDTAGNVLTDRGADTDPARKSNTRTEVQRMIEQRLTDDVKTMLTPVVGPDKSVVRVSADLDWDQYEANSETFSPNNKAPQVRSRRETSESSNQGVASAGGVPGAERNVPGYPAADGGQNGSAQADKRDVTTNYELSRTVEKTIRTPGSIKRLNVAVALDSDVIADPTQAEAITRLVATAAGLDTSRGDLVTLTSLPFSATGLVKPTEIAEQVRQREMMLSLARIVAMVLGPLLVVGIIWLVLRRNRPKPVRPNIQDVPTPKLEGPMLTAEQQIAALPTPEPDPEVQRIESELVKMARNDPAMMASLIRTWMNEDKKGF